MKRFLAALVCVTLAGLIYVGSETEAVKIGYQIRKLQEAKAVALDRASALKYNIAQLKAPHNLERRLLAERIALEPPKQWQTLVLSGGAAKISHPFFFTKFIVGTAQAEAKEPSSR